MTDADHAQHGGDDDARKEAQGKQQNGLQGLVGFALRLQQGQQFFALTLRITL